MQAVPSDYSYDAQSVPPCYNNADQTMKIAKDTEVRLRIVGTKYNMTSIFAIATIKADYLGPISQ